MEEKKQFIDINNDLSLEIQFNPLVSTNPFYLKIYSWEGSFSARMSNKDLINLAESLSDFAFDNANTSWYDQNSTGIPRLLLNQRNKAFHKLQEINNLLDEAATIVSKLQETIQNEEQADTSG
jgi:hypothetical protein